MAILSLSLALPVLAQETTESPAPADEGEISVSLALTGPPGCGSESDLASRIAWRTSRVRIVPVGASERRLDVALEVTDGSATATLSLTLTNGKRATRVLRAATCDEAIDAAALVAAVTLDPTASTATAPPPDAGAAGRAGASATGGTAASPVPSARPPEGQGGSAGTEPSAHTELSGSAFVPAQLIAGPAPELLYGLGFGVMGVWERGSIISPAVRLSFVYFFGQEFDEIGGTAYFALLEGNVDLCPFRIGNDTVGLFTCGSFAFGELTAEGKRTNDPERQGRSWLVLGGTLLLQARPVAPLELQLFGTLGAPLKRDSFQFGCPPGATDCEPNLFHVVPKVSAQGGLALGVFFR